MKEWSNRFNPFNSDKLMAHLYRWKEIQRGKEIPPPVLVTVDPTNVCNLSCGWCNSQYLQKQNQNQLSKETLSDLADFLKGWRKDQFGLEAVCIAGGGEPLLNPNTGYFIDKLAKPGCNQGLPDVSGCDVNCQGYRTNVKVGIVTNGIEIDKNLEALANCSWVGVSIDAGTPETYKKLKGDDKFIKVMENIVNLNEISKGKPLNAPGQGHGISYKYLLHPGNVREVYQAAKIAKEIGCRNMHIRPFGNPWDRKIDSVFSYGDIEEFQEQLVKARELEDETFKIFGITHKFDGNFNKANDFKECHAIFMTADFLPPTSNGKYNLGLCCDRRGDDRLTMEDLNDFNDVKMFWGSKEHWDMFDKIKVKECPRCTYQPHNILYEKAIKEDNLTYDFI